MTFCGKAACNVNGKPTMIAILDPLKSNKATRRGLIAIAADEISEEKLSEEEEEVSGEEEEVSIEEDNPDFKIQAEKDNMMPIPSSEVVLGQWVKVVYEEEIFIGKVLKIVQENCLVRCLKMPYGILVPQDFEREEATYYTTVYHTTAVPKLEKNSRGWKYIYTC